jgi:ABC-2 type transport system permease protein
VLAGKILASFTYVLGLLAALLATGLCGGTIAWGFNPVVDLTGDRVSAAHALGLAFAAIALFAVPLLAIASFGIFLSEVTRNSAAAIVGTLVYELVQEAIVGLVHWQPLHHSMLSAEFDAWHGVFQSPVFWPPIVRELWLSALFAAVPLAFAFAVFVRRDVAGD